MHSILAVIWAFIVAHKIAIGVWITAALIDCLPHPKTDGNVIYATIYRFVQFTAANLQKFSAPRAPGA